MSRTRKDRRQKPSRGCGWTCVYCHPELVSRAPERRIPADASEQEYDTNPCSDGTCRECAEAVA